MTPHTVICTAHLHRLVGTGAMISISLTGCVHYRWRATPVRDMVGFLRDWIHETPLSLCNAGADTCPDWELAEALADAIREHGGPLEMVSRDRLTRVTAERIAFLEKHS
jgi:hypothetical protein